MRPAGGRQPECPRRRWPRWQAASAAAAAGTAGGRGRPAQPKVRQYAPAEALDVVAVLQWLDAEKIDGFVTWTPFTHPTLGDGRDWRVQAVRDGEPTGGEDRRPGRRPREVRCLPARRCSRDVRIASTEVVSHGAGLYRVKAEVENTGYLPTALAQGVHGALGQAHHGSARRGPNDIIAGNEKTSFIQTLAGSGSRQSYEWIIKGKPGSDRHAEGRLAEGRLRHRDAEAPVGGIP